METVKIETFKMGDVIFHQGDEGNQMYAINSGQVGIYVNYGKDNERCLVELGEGRYFGEMAMIEDMPRSATAVAFEETQLTVISKADFICYIADHSDVAVSIMTQLSGRLRTLTSDYVDVCKTMAEAVAEGMTAKKPSLWEKMKKYAEDYDRLSNEAFVKSGYDAYYMMDHFSMYY